MSSPTFRFSQENFQFFGKDQEIKSFWIPPTDVDEAGTQLRAFLKREGAGTQFRALTDGRMEVALISLIDDDEVPANGQLIRKEIFTVDPDGKVDHQRKFEFNGQENKEQQELWEKRIEKLQTKFKSKDQVLQDYKNFVLKSLYPMAKGMTQAWDEGFLEQFGALSDEQKDFLRKGATELFNKSGGGYLVRSKADTNSYSLEFKDGKFQITLGLSVLDANGNLAAYLQDKFVIVPQGLQLDSHQRKWVAAGENPDAKLTQALKAMNEAEGPSKEAAKQFLDGLLSYWVNSHGPFFAAHKDVRTPTSGTSDGVWGQAKLKDFPKPKVLEIEGDFKETAPISERAKAVTYNPLAHPQEPTPTEKQQRDTDRSLSHGVALVGMTLLEKLYQDHDAAEGYLNKIFGEKKIYLDSEVKALNEVLLATQAAWEKNPDRSLLYVMKTLKLEGMAEERRKAMVMDPIVKQVSALEEESDAGQRAKDYMVMVRSQLLNDANRPMTARYLAQHLEFNISPEQSPIREEAHKVNAFFQGKADTGTALELQMPSFIDHVISPETIAAMYVGGLTGGFAEAGAMKGMQSLPWLTKAVRARSFASATFGLGMESAAFAGSHMMASTLRHDPKNVLSYDRFATETKSMFMLLGATRVLHGFASRFPILGERALIRNGRLIETGGRTKLGQKLADHSSIGKTYKRLFPENPAGSKILTDSMGRATGPAGPQLNSLGKAWVGMWNHVYGIGAMHGVMSYKDELGLRLPDETLHPPTVVDSAQSYFAAMLGFKLANASSGGRLQQRIAELKYNKEMLENAALKDSAIDVLEQARLDSAGEPTQKDSQKFSSEPGVEALSEAQPSSNQESVDSSHTRPVRVKEDTPPPPAVRSESLSQSRGEASQKADDLEIVSDPFSSSDPAPETIVDSRAPSEVINLGRGPAPVDPAEGAGPQTIRAVPKPAQGDEAPDTARESMFGKAAKTPADVDYSKSDGDATMMSAQPVSPDSRPEPLSKKVLPQKADLVQAKAFQPEELSSWDRIVDRFLTGGKMTRILEKGKEGLSLIEGLIKGRNELIDSAKELQAKGEQWQKYGEKQDRKVRQLTTDKKRIELAKAEQKAELDAKLEIEHSERQRVENELAEALESLERLEHRAKELEQGKDQAIVQAGDAIRARDRYAKQVEELGSRNDELQELVNQTNLSLARLRKADLEKVQGAENSFGEMVGRLNSVLIKAEGGTKSLESSYREQAEELNDNRELLNAKNSELEALREQLQNAQELQGAAMRGKEAAEQKVQAIKESLGELIPEVNVETMGALDAVATIKGFVKQSMERLVQTESELQETKAKLDATQEALEESKDRVKKWQDYIERKKAAQQERTQEVEAELQVAQERVQNLEATKAQQAESLRIQGEKIESLQQELATAQADKGAAEQKVSEVEREVRDIELKLSMKDIEVESLKKQDNDSSDKLRQQISELSLQSDRLNEELRTAKQDLEIERGNASTAEAEVRRLQAELKQLQEQEGVELTEEPISEHEAPTLAPPPLEAKEATEVDPDSDRPTLIHMPKASPVPLEAVPLPEPLQALSVTARAPRLPMGTQEGSIAGLTRANIRRGESKTESPQHLKEHIHEYGWLEGVTFEGVEYGDGTNHDGFARIIDAKGNLVLVSVDGAGGMGYPKKATEIILKTLANELPKNPDIQAAVSQVGENLQRLYDKALEKHPEYAKDKNFDPNGALELVRINRPEAPGKPFTFQSFYAGDSVTLLGRPDSNGRLQELWSSTEETQANAILGIQKPDSLGQDNHGVTFEIEAKIHPWAQSPANYVNRQGAKSGLRTLADGNYDSNLVEWVTLRDGSPAIAMKAGDRVILGSDGLSGNVASRAQILSLSNPKLGEGSLVKSLFEHNFAKQSLYQEAQKIIELRQKAIQDYGTSLVSEEHPTQRFEVDGIAYEAQLSVLEFGSHVDIRVANSDAVPQEVIRVPFQWGNQTYYLNNKGHVFGQAAGGPVIDVIKPDNLTALGFELNPETLSTGIHPAMPGSKVPSYRPPRHPNATPAETPAGKREIEDIYERPTIAPEESVDSHERPTLHGEESVITEKPTTALQHLSPGENLRLKSKLSEDADPEAVLYFGETGGWRIKVLAESAEIRVESEYDRSNMKSSMLGQGGQDEALAQVTKTLTSRGQEYLLPYGKHLIQVGGQDYMVVTQKAGKTAMYLAQSMDQAMAQRDPVSLKNRRPIKTEVKRKPTPPYPLAASAPQDKPLSPPKQNRRLPSPPPPPPDSPRRRPSPPPPPGGRKAATLPPPPVGGRRPSPLPPLPPGSKKPSPVPPPPHGRQASPPPPPRPPIVIPGVDTPANGPVQNKTGSGSLPPPKLPPKPPRPVQTLHQDNGKQTIFGPLPPLPVPPGRPKSEAPVQKKSPPPLPRTKKISPPEQAQVQKEGMEVQAIFDKAGEGDKLQYYLTVWRTAKRIVFGLGQDSGETKLGLFSSGDPHNWRFHLGVNKKTMGLFGGKETNFLTVRRSDPGTDALTFENRGKEDVYLFESDGQGKLHPKVLGKGQTLEIKSEGPKRFQIPGYPPFVIKFEN